jgi:hypothetical protein
MSNKKKYVKHDLSYKQKQKILDISQKNDIEPDMILELIESFFENFSEHNNLDFWRKISFFFNLRLLEDKTKQKAEDIVEIKKKIKKQKDLLVEYEDDYLAIIELGRALDSLNKL